MRGIKKLRNCEIIRNTERSCSDRRGHGGSEGSLGAQGMAIDGLGGLHPAGHWSPPTRRTLRLIFSNGSLTRSRG